MRSSSTRCVVGSFTPGRIFLFSTRPDSDRAAAHSPDFPSETLDSS